MEWRRARSGAAGPRAHPVDAQETGLPIYRVGIDRGVLAKGHPGHWGLTGMRERAHAIRSDLHLWSRDAAGTEVELVIPASIA